MKRTRAAALSLVPLLLLGASACGSDEAPTTVTSTDPSASSAEPVPATEALELIADGARIIDVRTPEEFEEGHLEGAVNIDVQEADFRERVSELPQDASYVVYCASGRRAVGAVEQMAELGFADVVNGGGYADLTEG